jgi:sugar/nucleoside kinase (ribokinase family)
MKVLTIGSAMRDVFLCHKQLPVKHLNAYGKKECFLVLQEGSKIEIDSIQYYTGGGATNTAVSFARLGFVASAFYKIGNDYEGNTISAFLMDEKIDTKLTVYDSHIKTGVSFIIPCPSGDRTVLICRGANNMLKEHEIPLDAFNMYDVLHVTSLNGPTAAYLPLIMSHAKKYNIFVASNPGTSQLKENIHSLQASLPFIDILILNAQEVALFAHTLMKKECIKTTKTIKSKKSDKYLPYLLQQPLQHKTMKCWLVDYCLFILNNGPSIVVVTNGAEGVYVATHDTLYFHPSISTDIVSTLGAGDAFASCFVASVLQKKSIEDSLVRGIINSSSILEYLDAKTGLLSTIALESKFLPIGIDKISTYEMKR